ncbi:MAG: superoxide dismutase [Sphingorhabdus sp.]
MINLTPLPFDDGALEPYISSKTLAFHHGKHHKAYVDKTNELVRDTDLNGKSLEDIIVSARNKANTSLYNQAGQAWNHGFYWSSLSPEKTEPSTELAEAIERSFGSMEEFKEVLKKEAIGHFASGWAWVLGEGGAISIDSSHDAETFACSDTIPLLVIDIWEHAYYLDHQNLRKDYVESVVENLLNWDFASRNFGNSQAWQYPG